MVLYQLVYNVLRKFQSRFGAGRLIFSSFFELDYKIQHYFKSDMFA